MVFFSRIFFPGICGACVVDLAPRYRLSEGVPKKLSRPPLPPSLLSPPTQMEACIIRIYIHSTCNVINPSAPPLMEEEEEGGRETKVGRLFSFFWGGGGKRNGSLILRSCMPDCWLGPTDKVSLYTSLPFPFFSSPSPL